MPVVKIYIHFVWSTKNRFPFLDSKEVRQKLWKHIRENAIEKDIYIDCINGYFDHCHCLVSLSIDQTLSKVMQLIKGESAFWVNKNGILHNGGDASEKKFEWQDEYYAVSVGPSELQRVRKYIYNQEAHHSQKSFSEELQNFITDVSKD